MCQRMVLGNSQWSQQHRPPTVGATSGVGEDIPSLNSSAERPFILSEGLPPVPHKVVARFLRGEYWDMAELLWDNLEAQRRGGAASLSSTPFTPRGRREVSDILSWVQWFDTYMAVIKSKFPHHIKELLAYQMLIVREVRHRGTVRSLHTHPAQVSRVFKVRGAHFPTNHEMQFLHPGGKGSSCMACFAWNQGDCRFPACKYHHVCVRCSGDYRAIHCP